MTERTPQSSTDEQQRSRLVARYVLTVIAVSYLVFLFFYVPRLNNFTLSDREFTGWVGPIAERVGRGQHLYEDLVLPIPPGSFVLLAAIYKIAGGPLLLHELWVAAASHFLMGLMAYAIAAKFSTRKVALLVALTTFVIVTQTPKECVYDHTSLVVAWLSMLVGAMALLEDSPARKNRFWFFTGLLSSGSLVFKQSTAVGMAAGWGLAFAYLVAVEMRAGRRTDARARLMDAVRWAAGWAGGLVVLALLLVLLRAPISGFVQTVFVDGPTLKGGLPALVRDLFMFSARNDAIRNTIVPTAVVFAIGVAVVRKHGSLHVGDEPENPAPLSMRAAGFLCLAALAAYGTATALLVADVRALERSFSATCESLRNVPAYGFVFGIAFFAGNTVESHATSPARRRAAHALNALLVASLVSSMIYDTSFILFSPFYYNEPSIPFAVLCLFMATERSGFRWATPLMLVASLLPIFGTKYNRALSDDTRVDSGHWAGLRVNFRGLEVLNAAARAQQLAGETGSVLVLPEDVELQGLIHRPRPPVKGAIVFVDQYPARLLANDLAALERSPPSVIVVHPRNSTHWKGLFHTWSNGGAAEKVVDHVLTKMLPKEYELDSSYPSTFFWEQGQIDVYARKRAEDE